MTRRVRIHERRHGSAPATLGALVLLGLTMGLASAQPVEALKRGVVRVTAFVDGAARMGTGFVVRLEPDAALIVTASHVVEGASSVEVEVFARRNRPLPAEVVGLEGGDPLGLAVLLVEERLAAEVTVLPLAGDPTLLGGEAVTTIGFPLASGVAWAVIPGTVAGRDGRTITFTGAVDEGSSGGPLLKDGAVVGVVTDTVGTFSRATPSVIVRFTLEGWGVEPGRVGVEAAAPDTREASPEVDAPPEAAAEVVPLPLPSLTATVLEGTVQEVGEFYAAVFSPDGRTLATSRGDGSVHLWTTDDAPEVGPLVLRGHRSAAVALAFSPDGRLLASGGWDATVRLWDMARPRADPITLTGPERTVYVVQFSPDGRWLAARGEDQTVWIWDVTDLGAEPVTLRGHGQSLDVMAFSPDGEWFVTGGFDGTARLWDVRRGFEEGRLLEGHEGRILSADISPDGRLLATGSADATVRLWDLRDATAAPEILRGHKDIVSALAFSPDGRLLASGGWDATARLWDLQNSAAPPRVLDGHDNTLWSVAFSPDGAWLATASEDDTARLWPLTTPSVPTAGPSTESIVLAENTDAVIALSFSPAGRWLVTGDHKGVVLLWDLGPLGLAAREPDRD